MIQLLLAAAALSLGCAHSGPKNVKEVIEEFGKPYEGVRSSPVELEDGDHRLEVFLGIVDEEAGPDADGRPQFKTVMWCIAENKEKDTLRYIKKRIDAAPAGAPLYVFGHRIKERYKWWFGGPDCFIKAIGVRDDRVGRYVYLNPLWGTPWHEWLDMKSALKNAVSKGVGTAVDIANPLN
ncbi:MAG: hypothetical protein V3T08_10100 [Gemmatimonadota bacterium]